MATICSLISYVTLRANWNGSGSLFLYNSTMSNEILSDAVNTIDLLQSIYFDKEFEFQRDQDEAAYKTLQGCWESDTWPTSFNPPLPSSLEFTIKAPVELLDQEDEEDVIYLTFNGQLSLTSITDYQLTLPSAANLWLSREDHESLVNTLNNEIQLDSSDDRSTWIIEKMQQLQAIAEPYALAKLQKSKQESDKAKLLQEGGPVRFLRDWIWFPMIYTREKVTYNDAHQVCVCMYTHPIYREAISLTGLPSTTLLDFYVLVSLVPCAWKDRKRM